MFRRAEAAAAGAGYSPAAGIPLRIALFHRTAPMAPQPPLTYAVCGGTRSRAERWKVGLTGFEPATSPTRTERATKLRHSPRGLA